MILEINRHGAEILIHPPHHYWLRFGVAFNYPSFESGHAWLYNRLVRRDAWCIGPINLYILQMPRLPLHGDDE